MKRLLSFIIMLVFTLQNLVWAYGFDKLAPESPFAEGSGRADVAEEMIRGCRDGGQVRMTRLRKPRGFYKEVAEFSFRPYPENHPAAVYLRDVARLFLGKMFPDKKPKVYLVYSPKIMGCTYPDGTICISDGLLKFVKYREELEFVLCHEMWHLKKGHLENRELFNLAQFFKYYGKRHIEEVEADMYSMIKADDVDFNPYGGIVYFRRNIEHQKKEITGSLAHGEFMDRIVQLMYPARIFDIESMSVSLTEVPEEIQKGLNPPSFPENRFETLFIPDDEDSAGIDPKVRERLAEKISNPIILYAGVCFIKERCEQFKKEAEERRLRFSVEKYKQEMELYVSLMERLIPYMKSLSGRDKKGSGKRAVFTEAVLWGLGLSFDLNTEQEVGIGEETADAIETEKDLKELIKVLKENIFLSRNLAVQYLPFEFTKFIVRTALEAGIFSDKKGFKTEKYLEFCDEFLDALEGLYRREWIVIEDSEICDMYLMFVKEAKPNLGEDEKEAVLSELVKHRYKGRFLFNIETQEDMLAEFREDEEPFEAEDTFVDFMLKKDNDVLGYANFAAKDFMELNKFLELLFSEREHKRIEEEFGAAIKFDPIKDKDPLFNRDVLDVIRKYFISRFSDAQYTIGEFMDELKFVSQRMKTEKVILGDMKSIEIGQEMVSKAIEKFALLDIDSREKAEALIYLTFYMENKSAAYIIQDKAFRYLAGILDFNGTVCFLDEIKDESFGAIQAMEEIIEEKARTPEQIRVIREKIKKFLEVKIPESEEVMKRLGKVSVMQLIINLCFKNEYSYRELLLCLTDPTNDQERLKRLCLKLYLNAFSVVKDNSKEFFDIKKYRNRDKMEKKLEAWILKKASWDCDRVSDDAEFYLYPFFFALKIGPHGIFRYFQGLDMASRYAVLHILLTGQHGVLMKKDGPNWLIEQLFNNFIKETKDPGELERLKTAKDVLSVFAKETVSRNQYDILYFLVFPLLFERFLKSDGISHAEKNYAKMFGDIVDKEFEDEDKPENDKKVIHLLIDIALRVERYSIEKELIQKGYITGDSSERIDSIGLILEIAQRMGAVGVRFLQLLGQYIDLPPEMEKEFLKVYDRMRGQSKLSAFSILEKECPEIVKDIADISPAVEGGSLRTTFILTMKDGRRLIAKILNPNALFHSEISMDVLEKVIECLYQTDPDLYGTAKMLLPDLREWIREDIKSEMQNEKDNEFKETLLTINGEESFGDFPYKTAVPHLVSAGKRHQIEEFIEGDNLTQWEKLEGEGHDLKGIVSLIVNNFIGQIAAGRLVHSDVHWGNFRVTKDKKVYILDRNYFIELAEKDKEFLFGMFMAGDGDLAESIIGYLLSYKPNSEFSDRKDFLKQKLSEKLEQKQDINGIILFLRGIGLKVPLKMTLMIKNLQSLERIAKKAGFENIYDAYKYFQSPMPEIEGVPPDIFDAAKEVAGSA